VDVVVALAVPQMADTPAIPVSSNAVIARTESFLRFMIVVFTRFRCVLEYMECYTQQYFRDSTLSSLEIFEKRDTRILVCRRMILLSMLNIMRDCKLDPDWKVYTNENSEEGNREK